MNHHKAIINLNQVPTVVETWGRWIEESPKTENEDIILCIPGNPGNTGYYRKFLETVHAKLQCPVWIIGHSGHQIINTNHIKVPKLDGNENCYNVQGQMEHKEEFIKKYVPKGARLFLIGHSIGAYICLKLLNNSEIKSKVVKSYLMFPALENIAITPNGKFLTKIIFYILWLIFFLSWIFTLFPEYLQNFLLYCYFKISKNSTKNIPATRDLIHPAVLRKIFFMAFDEMNILLDLEPNLIQPHMNKIKLYYGATDNWAPVSYYRNLVEKYPDINAELCSKNFSHAFVLNSSVEVGNMVAGWVQSEN